jgi:methionine-S-sulfoxide reductase
VGYSGGTQENPTYHNLGDHTETLQLDYDPKVTGYRDLLEVFWKSHSPVRPPWSRQYMSAIFYHSEEQKRLAVESKEEREAETGRKLFTEIQPASRFYLAEDYHQKYSLRRDRELMTEFESLYPEAGNFVDSTAAARVNGLLAGYGAPDDLLANPERLGLSPRATKRLLSAAGR